jgi:hypothetical protein
MNRKRVKNGGGSHNRAICLRINLLPRIGKEILGSTKPNSRRR